MAEYLLKVVVEAIQVRADNWENIFRFVPADQFAGVWFKEDGMHLHILTSGGVVVAREGDWVVKGMDERVYPVQKDVFEEICDPVGDEE